MPEQQLPRRAQLNAADTLRTIGQSPIYGQERAALGEKAQTLDGRRLAVGKAATRICTEMGRERNSTHLNLEQHSVNVVGKLMQSIDDMIMLDAIKDGLEPNRDSEPHKRKVMHFDRALKEMVDDNPSIGFKETLAFLGQSITSIAGEDTFRKVAGNIKNILIGMRHEIIAEQMLEYLDIDYRQSTEDEDLKGKDIIILKNDRPFAAIDIKSTENAALETRMKARKSGYKPKELKVALSTGCKESDLGNSFRLDNELMEDLAPLFKADLMKQLATESARMAA